MAKAVIFDMYETLITHYCCPLYFSQHMAADAGLDPLSFREKWRETDKERTLGEMTFEESLEDILRSLDRYDPELFEQIRQKRIATKQELFRHLHEEIIPMLNALKSRGIAIGLISNCFSEESAVIRSSILWPYFDAACLSCELGLRKPDPAIFHRCTQMLGLKPEDCLYVGDGGSMELEGADAIGMETAQALWYLHDEIPNQSRPKPEFRQLERPLSLLEII